MYRKQVRRRRAVLVALIVTSLVLLSAHFSEAQSGPLHAIQRGVATILSPLESVASEALKPARDLIDWFDETFEARGENDDLREELADVRAQLAEAQGAVDENEQFRSMLALNERLGLDPSYQPLTARIISRSPSVINSTVGVNAGSGDGVEIDDPVITGDGLVGRVSEVTNSTAQVQLITDPRNAVSARVLSGDDAATGPQGILEPVAGDPDDLRFDFISDEEDVEEGQMLVTAGWSNGEISSAYPYGIPIGEVTDTTLGEEDFQRVTVQPFADMQELQYVQILTGGPARPGVSG
jgi:rod shape-determining protein MreC